MKCDDLLGPTDLGAVLRGCLVDAEWFKGMLRDELLDGETVFTLPGAEVLVERWRLEYDPLRPQSGLGYRPSAPEAWSVDPTTSRTDRPASAAALRGAGGE